MTCAAILMLTLVILFIGTLLLFGLLPTALAILALSLVLIPLAVILLWRYIYPWLVRMGRWSAQLRNIIFLFIVVVVAELVLGHVLGLVDVVPTVTILGIEVTIIGLVFLLLWLFLLLLAIVVWLVRLWRRGWPTTRDVFWDIISRIVGLVWRILLGIPLGITWFFYHPPLRWLVAALLFYLRGISAAIAWLLYNPPLRGIAIGALFVIRLIARPTGWLLYNPPICWVIQFGLFFLRLIARFNAAIIYGIWSWWPVTGVRRILRKGLTAESKSYQDYKYAQNDGSASA